MRGQSLPWWLSLSSLQWVLTGNNFGAKTKKSSMNLSFKNIAGFSLLIVVSVALAIVLADKYMFKQEQKRQQKLAANGSAGSK
jgi:hypothetical protein